MAAEIKSRREAAAVAIEVRDKEYRAELIMSGVKPLALAMGI